MTLRHREELYCVRITIEGTLAPERASLLIEDARAKLAAIERTPYVARRLG